MMPPFSVNAFVTSAWLMPQRRLSIIGVRLLTCVGSPLFCLPTGAPPLPPPPMPPGGGTMMLSPPRDPPDEPPPPEDELDDSELAESSDMGSTPDACLGSVG